MRMISTKVHAVLDYVVGIALIVAPWLFGFAYMGAETWIPVILGAMTVVMSLMTNYEFGVLRIIPVPLHLWMDGLSGLFLAASPWLFGFADLVFVPHLLIGITEIIVPMLTEKQATDTREYRANASHTTSRIR